MDNRTQLEKNLDYKRKVAIAKKLEQARFSEMYKKLMCPSQTTEEQKILDTPA